MRISCGQPVGRSGDKRWVGLEIGRVSAGLEGADWWPGDSSEFLRVQPRISALLRGFRPRLTPEIHESPRVHPLCTPRADGELPASAPGHGPLNRPRHGKGEDKPAHNRRPDQPRGRDAGHEDGDKEYARQGRADEKVEKEKQGRHGGVS